MDNTSMGQPGAVEAEAVCAGGERVHLRQNKGDGIRCKGETGRRQCGGGGVVTRDFKILSSLYTLCVAWIPDSKIESHALPTQPARSMPHIYCWQKAGFQVDPEWEGLGPQPCEAQGSKSIDVD